jgi:non-specific serine/threonine protein kinase
MRDAIAWSYDLLAPDEQAFFRRVAALVGGGDLEAVAAVTSGAGDVDLDALSGVRVLVEKSLLTLTAQQSGEPRYGMLETIREFGLEQLAASGEENATRAAHAAYFLELARDAESHLIASGSAEWVERLAIERGNLQVAVSWALQQGKTEAVLRLAGTILSLAYARGEPREGQQWLEAALVNGSDAAPDTRIDALFTASALAQVRGDFVKSTALSEEGLHLARECGYIFGEARALLQLGITAEWQGDLDLAATRYESARELMSSLDDPTRLPHWTILPVANLADVALLRGDARLAAALAQEAIDGWREAGYLWGLAQALGTAGAAACELGNLNLARRVYDETLTLWLDGDDGRGIAGTLAGIAGIAVRDQQLRRAARLLGAAWSLADALGVRFLAHHVYAERVLATTRSRLDDEVFNAAWREGGSLSLEQAVSEARRILHHPSIVPASRDALPARELTARELEVLRLLVGGQPDREIAASLRVSPRTIQTHVANLFAKFGVNSRVELTAVAVRRNLV